MTIFILLVMVGPMVPFSDFIEHTDEYPVLSSKITIDILTNRGVQLSPMFSSEMMLRTDSISKTLVTYR